MTSEYNQIVQESARALLCLVPESTGGVCVCVWGERGSRVGSRAKLRGVAISGYVTIVSGADVVGAQVPSTRRGGIRRPISTGWVHLGEETERCLARGLVVVIGDRLISEDVAPSGPAAPCRWRENQRVLPHVGGALLGLRVGGFGAPETEMALQRIERKCARDAKHASEAAMFIGRSGNRREELVVGQSHDALTEGRGRDSRCISFFSGNMLYSGGAELPSVYSISGMGIPLAV